MSLNEARRMALSPQGLFLGAANSALATVRKLGYVQIDTISVIERAHHHTVWTRTPGYTPGDLEQLVRSKKIFEYWWHAAAYLPIEDFRFSLPRKKALAAGEAHWFKKDKKIMRFVFDRIKAEGPLKSSDFETPKKSGPWWGWKPAKQALEQLFQDGKLMIARREGFQKVYDLAERVLPATVDASMPTEQEFGEFLVGRTIRAHGIVNERELGYLQRPMARAAIKKALPALIESGDIREGRIHSLPGKYFFKKRPPKPAAPRLSLLSPFDNAVIQRRRLKELFGFDYQIECYVPKPKRNYGYFCLPILWGDRFVGRLDPKADRKSKQLLVQSLHWEKGAPAVARAALPKALERFAAFNGCQYHPV
ncbi:MAG: hypothetical protein COB53_01545 [Elusimicrobia bacterium]|nr:MAG: hypothetical protein COB53_01545 [Elusimicrobiota bacterium]